MKRLPGIFLLCFAVCTVLAACGRRELPVLGQLPSFHLTDQNERLLSLEGLRGQVWVANFVFTSCGHTCPLLTQRMKGVQERLKEWKSLNPEWPLGIVSFSVDPERDTPAVLAEYAKRFGADTTIWRFATGSVEEVENTVVRGFKMAMGKVPLEGAIATGGPGEIFDVLHGEKFVLVDQKGRIRGYYASENGQEMRRMLNDLQALLASGTL